MAKATYKFQAVRAAVEAAVRGWTPLGWVFRPSRQGYRYPALHMRPPTPMTRRQVVKAATGIVIAAMGRSGRDERPWTAAHEKAMQAITAKVGQRPGESDTGSVRFAVANIVTAFGRRAVGTKVLDREALLVAAAKALEVYDTSSDRVAGQHFVMCPEAIPFVSAGIGRRTRNPEDYVLRDGRFGVEAYLKRKKATEVEGLALVVYTRDAYLADPDLQTPEEAGEKARIEASDCSHVIVAVLAFAGPKSPLPPATFIHNLAGGNHEVEGWSKEEVCQTAAEVEHYWDEWCIVAD